MELASKVGEIVSLFVKKVLSDANINKLIKSIVLVGSAARNELNESSDIDILVIIDDTIHIEEEEIKINMDKIEDILNNIARNVSRRLSIHLWSLTEFTEYASNGHPIVYTFIKDGIPLYDVGFFTPWKILLKSGKIPRTKEAAEKYLEEVPRKLLEAKASKVLIVAENCYKAMTNSAQAVLMLLDQEPSPPSKLPVKVKEKLVDAGLLKLEYVKWLEDIIKFRKKVEHGEVTEVPGTLVDEWINKADEFVSEMLDLSAALELLKAIDALKRTYVIMLEAIARALKALHDLPKEMSVEELEKRLGMSVKEAFKKEFINTRRVDPNYLEVIERVENLKKEAIDNKNISVLKDKVDEVYQLREKIRSLICAIGKTIRFESNRFKHREVQTIL